MRKPRPLRSRAGTEEPVSDGLRVSSGTGGMPAIPGSALRETHTRLIAAPAKSSRAPPPPWRRRRTLRFLRYGCPYPGFVKTAGCEHQRYSVRLADLILARFMLYRGITDGSSRIFYAAPSDVLFIRKPLRSRMCQHRCKNYTLIIIPLSAREVNMSGDIVPPNSTAGDRIF